MRIAARGWHRNCGNRRILGGDLYDEQLTTEVSSKTHLFPEIDEDGNVLIEAMSPRLLHLNGNYQIHLCLTRQDIVHLARLIFRGQDFEKVVAALSGGRKAA